MQTNPSDKNSPPWCWFLSEISSVILRSVPLAVCFSPTFWKTWLFLFLCVHFLSYVISAVISIAQSLQSGQGKCTTANWNLVRKKKRNSWLIKVCWRGFSQLSLFKGYVAESHRLPLGFNSLSVLSVERMGGWPEQCCTNNMLVYAAWMQMIDWGHKLEDRERQKTSYMQPRFADEFGGSSLLPKESVWSGPSLPQSDVAALLWLHLLCFAPYRYKFWFWKFKRAVPEEDDWLYNRAERQDTHWDFPCFSENWGENEGGREGL